MIISIPIVTVAIYFALTVFSAELYALTIQLLEQGNKFTQQDRLLALQRQTNIMF